MHAQVLRPAPTPVAQRRLPEHHAQAQYRAFRLLNEVGGRRGPGAGAQVRDRAKHDAPFSGYPAALQANLQAALERAVDDAARRALLDGLAHGARRSAAVEVLSDLLVALRHAPFEARDAMRASAWLDVVGFHWLTPSVRRRFVEADLRLAACASWKRLAPVLLRAEGVTHMPVEAQAELLLFAIGPVAAPGSAPARAAFLAEEWASRRTALRVLLEGRAFRAARPSLQAELLQDYLHDPVCEVWVLQATALTGHAAVVLGAPGERGAPSYGRRWVRTPSGKPRAVLSSPDPTVRSGWRRPAIDAVTRYAGDRYVVSRAAEVRFVRWLEETWGAGFGQDKAPGVRSGHAAPSRFIGALEDALRFFAGRGPTRAVVLGGERVDEGAARDESSEALLQAYLSA
ncbi:MAG: hypothetical protein H6730_15745 [Deltaproteobacteria bacterium]|nr:hypothetical protein [Deltaproteobacteria bacterium]